MATKIRLQRHGRKKRPFYHIVIADSRAPRDGRFIEKIGTYNPMTKPATIELDRDRAFDWLMMGAQPTDTARSILRFKGVLYKKHLQLGVTKGAISQEQADEKYNAYIEDKEARIARRFEQTARERAEFLAKVNGTPPPPPAPEPEPEPEAPAAEVAEEEGPKIDTVESIAADKAAEDAGESTEETTEA